MDYFGKNKWLKNAIELSVGETIGDVGKIIKY